MPIPSSPFSRYRASQLALSDGDPVATWADETANGNDLTQGTGSRQPVLDADGFNGLPGVVFDGADDFLQTASYSTPLGQPNTLVAIMKWLTVPGAGEGFGYVFDGLSGARNTLLVDGNDDGWRVFAGNNTITFGTAKPPEDTRILVATIYDDATTTELYVDNQFIDDDGTVGSDDLGGLTLGDRFSADTGPLHAVIAEVLIYDRALNSTERDELFAYYEATYIGARGDVSHGIILGHQADSTVGVTSADVAHGIVLGHQVEASIQAVADVAHGIVLGHEVEGTVEEVVTTADVTHGIVLGHQVEASSAPVADVAHGILLGHQVVFAVEVLTRTRPLQPVADRRPAQQQADLRPLQPTWSSVP